MRKILVKSLGTDVGHLYKDDYGWVFEYCKTWVRSGGIRVGFRLTTDSLTWRSKDLFVSFKSRIPSRDNPNYGVFCKNWDISELEKDEMTLLVTLGHRGPSSFTYHPVGFAPGIWSEEG